MHTLYTKRGGGSVSCRCVNIIQAVSQGKKYSRFNPRWEKAAFISPSKALRYYKED